ncbi:hypothetical protein [Tepidiforma thermophila]|uniref:Apea-like HEPN domain-containing protein n=1 Tax=Tepidiforma thermophila (strain KCTC 52669 / CGMCC 1.13589 / G233) TaxID=2761530 RepID=A0A2A9HCD7_TEPT2|nr:hypothetical protein [Tepidiforma thermophila]PFG73408.1 hypothetical protein A9A59_0603 [Tepidiforma thermophila]
MTGEKGFLIIRGVQPMVNIHIIERPDGNFIPQFSMKLRYSAAPFWIWIASKHRDQSLVAGNEIAAVWDTSDADNRARMLESELSSCSQTIVSLAIAWESFQKVIADSIRSTKDVKASWKKNRKSAAKKITQTMELAFDLKKETGGQLHSHLSALFRLRNMVVHPSAEFADPVWRDDVRSYVSPVFAELFAERVNHFFSDSLHFFWMIANQPKSANRHVDDHRNSLRVRLLEQFPNLPDVFPSPG